MMMLTGIKQTIRILEELKKTNGHLSLPRLHRIIMQRKKRAKVEQIRVVSLKSSIKCCANVNNYGLCNILSLTQHRHDADWDKADKQDF